MRNFIYLIIFVAGLVISLKVAPDMMMNYSGYCAKEGRYLTDQEKIDVIVKKLLNPPQGEDPRFGIAYSAIGTDYIINSEGGKEFIGTERKEVNFRRAAYSSLEDFYSKNPNCCRLTETMPGEGKPVSIPPSWRRSGKFNTFVLVYFLHSYDVRNNLSPVYSYSRIPISNCGDVIKDEIPYK